MWWMILPIISILALSLGAIVAHHKMFPNLPLIMLSEFIISNIVLSSAIVGMVGEPVLIYVALGAIMSMYATIFKTRSRNIYYTYIICAAYYTLVAIESYLGYFGMFSRAYTWFMTIMAAIQIYFAWGYEIDVRGLIKRCLPSAPHSRYDNSGSQANSGGSV